ncbi:MAG: hypothetical protein Kow00106_22430 [Anaerolineae bacterium]
MKGRLARSREADSYAAIWESFCRLHWTQDSLAQERRGWRRWLLRPVVAFIVPIDDEAVLAQLQSWQSALSSWLAYTPQPADRLHITLHVVGRFSSWLWVWLPHAWRRRDLERLSAAVVPLVRQMEVFTVGVGPLNAFPNALFAEVQDETGCLRALRTGLRRALPRRARPPLRWPFVPHVTLGYWGRQPATSLIAALTPFRQVEPVPLRVERVRLTIYALNDGPSRVDLLRTAREEIIAEFALKP